jgi:hypothetical protein
VGISQKKKENMNKKKKKKKEEKWRRRKWRRRGRVVYMLHSNMWDDYCLQNVFFHAPKFMHTGQSTYTR